MRGCFIAHTLWLLSVNAINTKFAINNSSFFAPKKLLCPSLYDKRGDNCYHHHHQPMTWTDASLYCQKTGGNLVSVKSEDENVWLADTARIILEAPAIWIGLYTDTPQRTFVWKSSNVRSSYFNWHQNEPNNYRGAENCVQLFQTGYWNDKPCDTSIPFVCEAKPTRPLYDFVVDIPTLPSVVNGWPVSIANDALNTTSVEINYGIIGVLGYYSKGKSFVVNHLFNAGKKTVSASHRLNVATGSGIVTRGLSGVFTGAGVEEDIRNGTILIIDTAGRNAPAMTSELKPGETLWKAISELRSKERFIDDLIIELSDIILYVVDEVLNEDQRTILFMIEQIARNNRKQKLRIVHNMKREGCDEKSKKHITEQVLSAFDAKEVNFLEGYQDKFGGSLKVYRSKWFYNGADISWGDESKGLPSVDVDHLVLFNQELCWRENEVVFDYMMMESTTQTQVSSPFSLIVRASDKHLSKHVRLVDSDKPCMANSDAITSPFVISAVDPTVCLETLEWQLREMPSATSQGEFTPSHSHIIEEQKRDIIRVDLPGLNIAKYVPMKGTVPDTGSFFQLTIQQSGEHKKYTIRGRREPPPHETKSDVFGTFNLQFDVSYKFSKILPVRMDNSVLIIESVVPQEDFDIEIVVG
jgi:hypothetical protein